MDVVSSVNPMLKPRSALPVDRSREVAGRRSILNPPTPRESLKYEIIVLSGSKCSH